MEKKSSASRTGLRALIPQLVILLLLGLAFGVVATTVEVNVSHQAGIVMELPDQAGEWVGDEIRYCTDRDCGKDWRASELDDRTVCPACGAPLHSMSIQEADVLPEDTDMLKKQYLHPNGDRVFVSIVLSGRDRASIHRPQACLAGQGNSFEREMVIPVPLAGRSDLEVMVLDMVTNLRRPNQPDLRLPRYYAYWFVGKDRETPHHGQRMLYMGLDRVLRSVAHRWAYISVSGLRDPARPDAHFDEIREVLALIYPAMVRPDA